MIYLNVGQAITPALALLYQQAEGSSLVPWWGWLVLIALLLLLLLIGLILQSEPGQPLPKPEERAARAAAVAADAARDPEPEAPAGEEEAPEIEVAPAAEVDTEQPSEPAEAAVEVAPADDLKRIEGIGPKISAMLNENGVTTFAALAGTDPQRLQEMLDEAGIRLAKPTTWPEQAELAAAGQWDELEKLQDNLKGGRGKE